MDLRHGSSDLNPYASPREAATFPLSMLPPERWSGLRMEVVAVEKRAMTRRVIVAGDIEADLFYNGWEAGETVTINGRQRVRGSAWEFLRIVNPRIDFTVEGPEWWVPASVHVQARLGLWPFFRIARFSLVVAGWVLHQED